jgi:hypothetical protein
MRTDDGRGFQTTREWAARALILLYWIVHDGFAVTFQRHWFQPVAYLRVPMVWASSCRNVDTVLAQKHFHSLDDEVQSRSKRGTRGLE